MLANIYLNNCDTKKNNTLKLQKQESAFGFKAPLHIITVYLLCERPKIRIKHFEVSFKSDLIFIRSVLFQDLWHFMKDKFLFVIFFLQPQSLSFSLLLAPAG